MVGWERKKNGEKWKIRRKRTVKRGKKKEVENEEIRRKGKWKIKMEKKEERRKTEHKARSHFFILF